MCQCDLTMCSRITDYKVVRKVALHLIWSLKPFPAIITIISELDKEGEAASPDDRTGLHHSRHKECKLRGESV